MERNKAIKKYLQHKKMGLVDGDIIPILEKINELECCYTTSSCSGRIAVIQIPRIGDKENAQFLGKWHRRVSVEEVIESLKKYDGGYSFLVTQSAIIHIVCDNIDDGRKMLNIALESGFKYSSIKSIKNGKVVIEILSTENLSIPLGKDGKILVGEKEIEFFVEIANEILMRIKDKLRRFEEKIRSLPASFCI